MSGLLLTLQLLVAATPAVRVDARGDAKLPCAAGVQLKQALTLRVPQAKVSIGVARAGELTARLTRRDDAWLFTLLTAGGQTVVERELGALACEQAADTAALIVERHLAELAVREPPDAGTPPAPTPPIPDRRPPPSAPSRPNPPATEAAIPAAPDDGTNRDANRDSNRGSIRDSIPRSGTANINEVEASEGPAGVPPGELAPVVPAEPSSPLLWSPTILVGAGGWLGVPTDLSLAFTLDVSARVFANGRVSLLAFGALPRSTTITYDDETRGTRQTWALTAAATGGFCGGSQTVQGCSGLLAGARITTASTAGPDSGPRLYGTRSATATLPLLGLFARAELALGSRFRLAAQLTGAAPLGRATFDVRGITDAAYATPPVDLLLCVLLGVRL